jgi:two-component system, NarL family, nitrate/nitrite response regulator NarL
MTLSLSGFQKLNFAATCITRLGIALTTWPSDGLLILALTVVGPKHDSPSLLSQAIRHVFSGGVWFKQEQLQSAVASRPQMSASHQSDGFTARERMVLSYVFEGLANRKIAERIGVSTGSVKAAMQQLFSKTGVRTRSQLVRIVLEQHKDQL